MKYQDLIQGLALDELGEAVLIVKDMSLEEADAFFTQVLMRSLKGVLVDAGIFKATP